MSHLFSHEVHSETRKVFQKIFYHVVCFIEFIKILSEGLGLQNALGSLALICICVYATFLSLSVSWRDSGGLFCLGFLNLVISDLSLPQLY